MEKANLSSGVLSILPMIYVAWADSVLGPTEFDVIHEKISELKFLSQEDKALMLKWTDPLMVPKPETFKWWIGQMKQYGEGLNAEEKQSLVRIGLHLAQASTSDRNQNLWSSPKTMAAIYDIQQALEISEKEGIDLLLHKIEVSRSETYCTPQFSYKEMQGLFDSTYTETRVRMRKLLTDPVFEIQHIRDKEEYRKHILEWTKLLAKQGLGSYAYPVEYGGRDDQGAHITVFEMLGFHDLSLAVKFGVQFGLFGSAINNLGTTRHHKAYVKDLSYANLLGCFAMTETGHGSNVKGLETTLTYHADDDSIVVHTPHRDAGKAFIGNAFHSTHAVIFGQLIIGSNNHGVHAVVVKIRDSNHELIQGVEVEDCGYKMGLNGIDNGRLYFNEVRVSRLDLLDKFGKIDSKGKYQSDIKSDSGRFFTMLSALVAGRVSVALASVSVSKKALVIAVQYALKRRQFAGRKGQKEMLIMDYPSHQRRLIPLIANAYALDFALKDLTALYVKSQKKEEKREVESLAAGLKAMASWNATRTIQECREACGGEGYLVENQFTDLKADSEIFSTFEGDNTVLLQLVAKGLLSNMQKLFHDEGYIAVMRYLSQKIFHTITEYNVYFTRRTDVEHLLDPDFYLDAFLYRLNKLLDTVASRMKKYIAKRVHPTDAFLRCQNHMIELAKAHIELVILKSFYKKYRKVDDGLLKDALLKMYQMYALSTIEKNKEYFLENDYMDGRKSKAIRRIVNKLCSDIRPDVSCYVNAFGIPEELIKAPIAL